MTRLPAFPNHSSRRTRGFFRVALLCIAFGAMLCTSSASAKPKTHKVYSGQRLGSIAKRYNVSVEALCRANGITRRTVIKPGQKLIIPGTDDGSDRAKSKSSKPEKPKGRTRLHTVAKGHTLSAIAGRYAITVTALCHANGIGRNASLSVGQNLIIPHRSDKGGKYAAHLRTTGKLKSDHDDDKTSPDRKKSKSRSGNKSWAKYIKPAWRRGYIKIRRYGRSWKGYVIGPKGQVLGHASNKINYVLGAKKDGPRIAPKLIRLIASISDKFGGREMRIVSGYRTKSFVAASKHKRGKALDFSIPGIPNEALRDYLRTLDNVGVGYYPNSSFVHLDVRGYNSYWVDHAGPGEPPRKSPKHRLTKKSTRSNHKKNDPQHNSSKNSAPTTSKERAAAPSSDNDGENSEAE